MTNFRLGFISLKFGKPCSVRFNDGLGVWLLEAKDKAMFEWNSVPGWVVAMMFGGMIALAYQLGTKTAELRFSGRDARRYSWLRRQHWVRDGAERLDGCDVDRMCDIGQVKEGIAAFAGNKTPK